MSPIRSNLAEQQLPQELEHPTEHAAPETPALALVTGAPRRTEDASLARRLLVLGALGSASAVLYALLFVYADHISALATATRNGAKYYALVPIGIALVFSLVHGAFTHRFWRLVGLRARRH